jgi:hypothetical protein
VRFPSRLCGATSGSTVSSAVCFSAVQGDKRLHRQQRKCQAAECFRPGGGQVSQATCKTEGRDRPPDYGFGFPPGRAAKNFCALKQKLDIISLLKYTHYHNYNKKYFCIFTFKMCKNTITATFCFLNIWKHHYLSWLSSH